MAKFQEIDETLWNKWVAERPEVVRSMCERIRPDTLYKMKSTGSRVFPVSYNEDGTLTVAVTGRFNFVTFDRSVFGISPDDLEECDLPSPEELNGTMLVEKTDIDAFISIIAE